MIAITGAGGFLGWHTRVAIHAAGGASADIPLRDETTGGSALDGVDRAIHLAGVNRGTDEEVADGNLRLAEQFARIILTAETPPPVVVFANSTQSQHRSVYGDAKRRSAAIIEEACSRRGVRFDDVVLPNLFGEHGRPFYNSVFATFATLLAQGQQPTVEVDRPLTLLHAQDAADALLGDEPGAAADTIGRLTVERTVSELLGDLSSVAGLVDAGEIPDVSTSFRRDLVNSYRSYAIDAHTPISLDPRADARGTFTEIVKAHGGSGQTSISTTKPGVTRGQHFHRRKIERFVVLAGTARISMRRLFSDQPRHYDVSGSDPVAVDMPTGWAHSITNTGDTDLLTAFWTNELFDPDHPDTTAEDV